MIPPSYNHIVPQYDHTHEIA